MSSRAACRVNPRAIGGKRSLSLVTHSINIKEFNRG